MVKESLREKIAAANEKALAAMLSCQPVWVDVRSALDVLPGMTANTVLHAGPPIAWEKMCGPQRRGVIDAVIYEGLANTRQSAKALVENGEIHIAPCHDYNAVGGMAGITSASTPMAVVRDEASGKEGYSQLFQGPRGQLQNRDDYNKAAIRQWRWIETVLGPALQAAIRARGGLDVRNLTAKALQMGDECHNRNSAGSALLFLAMTPSLIRSCPASTVLTECIEYLASADQFSLCISMAAAKVSANAAKGVPYSTIVTAMARNGVEFGIKVSGLDEQWFTGPANRIEGLYFSSEWSDKDSVPDLGDSAIMETVGLGGHVQAAAPALQQFVGGSMARAIELTEEMRQITCGVDDAYRIPNLDFAAAPVGTDIRKVVQTGVTPVIDTAIAHKKGGVIGAGQTRAPLECFNKALLAYSDRYRSKQ
ncbi:MAG: DUF1116 domain-containing protein [Gammaproteobacteria bacterium]|nr:DUF1116 domain-containing protein [Gammaproteobacteria bacterium]